MGSKNIQWDARHWKKSLLRLDVKKMQVQNKKCKKLMKSSKLLICPIEKHLIASGDTLQWWSLTSKLASVVVQLLFFWLQTFSHFWRCVYSQDFHLLVWTFQLIIMILRLYIKKFCRSISCTISTLILLQIHKKIQEFSLMSYSSKVTTLLS